MSLSRLALRLAAYEALNPYASIESGPWPTIAGKNVWDSRITPIAGMDAWGDFTAGIEGKPVVIVYTEETEVEPTAGEYPADKEMVDLVVEMQIAAAGSVAVVAADGTEEILGTLVAPFTSRQHEAMLDLLEAQVRNVLDPQGYAASGSVLQGIARELHHVHSVPQRDAEKVTRFAARSLRMKVRVPLTVWPALLTNPPPVGLAVLPKPLCIVANRLDPNSSGGALCANIANMIAPAAAPVPLTDIRISADFNLRAAPGAALAIIADAPFVAPT